MNILVVEDDHSTSKVILRTVEECGHEVEVSATGKDALAKLGQKEFHLVLLDIFLPDVLGYELIPRLKELAPQAGIIAMTGHNSRELELQVRKQSILYYMIKPFETKYLKSLLDHISKTRNQQLNFNIREVITNGRISGNNGSGNKCHGRS